MSSKMSSPNELSKWALQLSSPNELSKWALQLTKSLKLKVRSQTEVHQESVRSPSPVLQSDPPTDLRGTLMDPWQTPDGPPTDPQGSPRNWVPQESVMNLSDALINLNPRWTPDTSPTDPRRTPTAPDRPLTAPWWTPTVPPTAPPTDPRLTPLMDPRRTTKGPPMDPLMDLQVASKT